MGIVSMTCDPADLPMSPVSCDPAELAASLAVLQEPQFQGELRLASAIIRCVVEFAEGKYGRKDEDLFGGNKHLAQVSQTVESQEGEENNRNPSEDNSIDSYSPKQEEKETKGSELRLDEADQNVLTLRKLEQDITSIEKHLVSHAAQIDDEQQIMDYFKVDQNYPVLENNVIEGEQHMQQQKGGEQKKTTRSDKIKTQKEDRSEEFSSLKCPECDFETSSLELQEHLNVNHHVCEICGERGESESGLKNHYTIHTNLEGEFKCPAKYCRDTFRLRWEVGIHVNLLHGGVEIKPKKWNEKTTCNICQKTLATQCLRGHMNAIHGDRPMLYCSECEFLSKYQHNIKSHMQTVHGIGDPVLCTKCDFKTFCKKKLKRHEAKHDQPPEERMRKRREVKEHIKKVKENPVVICPICPYKARKESMMLHDEMHSRGGLLDCNVCDFKTGNRHTLKQHIKVRHEGGEEYRCKEEGCSFKGPPYKLKIHTGRHNTENSIKCDKCAYSTSSTENLKSHLLCHEEPKYLCNVCDYKTWNSANFSTHKITKHGSITHSCDNCDFVTKSRRTFRQHKMKHEEFEAYLSGSQK